MQRGNTNSSVYVERLHAFDCSLQNIPRILLSKANRIHSGRFVQQGQGILCVNMPIATLRRQRFQKVSHCLGNTKANRTTEVPTQSGCDRKLVRPSKGSLHQQGRFTSVCPNKEYTLFPGGLAAIPGSYFYSLQLKKTSAASLRCVEDAYPMYAHHGKNAPKTHRQGFSQVSPLHRHRQSCVPRLWLIPAR